VRAGERSAGTIVAQIGGWPSADQRLVSVSEDAAARETVQDSANSGVCKTHRLHLINALVDILFFQLFVSAASHHESRLVRAVVHSLVRSVLFFLFMNA
jgi:hypothetical protein